MYGIVITGHGKFASGMLSNMELILGQVSNSEAVDFLEKDSVVELEIKLRAAIDKLQKRNEEILILTDLLNGSPFNVSMSLVLKNKHLHLIYGVNAAILLEAFMQRETRILTESNVSAFAAMGKQQIGIFSLETIEKEKRKETEEDL